jgi:hypothetical protein
MRPLLADFVAKVGDYGFERWTFVVNYALKRWPRRVLRNFDATQRAEPEQVAGARPKMQTPSSSGR